MVNVQKAREDNDRINALLRAEPEYLHTKEIIEHIKRLEGAAVNLQSRIKSLGETLKEYQLNINSSKELIAELLTSLESKTGFSKAPGLAHLMTVSESYEVADMNAVPKEYIITEITSKLDKKKLNAAIKSGEVAKDSNWLNVKPSYKTVVIE
jgi:hypothetical protein